MRNTVSTLNLAPVVKPSSTLGTPASVGPSGNVKEDCDEMLRLIKRSEYNVVDQLLQTPSKISVLSLLLNSEPHREALQKVLDVAYVDHDVTKEDNIHHTLGNILLSSDALRFEERWSHVSTRTEVEHVEHLLKLFQRLRKYKLCLNPNKCTFGVRSGKLLGFIVSERGIEVDPAKVKAIQEMPAPKTEKQVRGFLGRLNYISRFISHMTATCAPIFKLLQKDQSHDWTEDCRKAFDNIKEYLSEPPIMSPSVEGRPLIMYLTVLEDSMGCVLGQQDESEKKEYAIYYLSKKFTDCESLYSMLEKTCCALAWAAKRLR
ncbi:hypothetical protein KIW84_044027 [Lathyrus oleraceus]|uniref:Reverse transcriptase/retrotransposon-derived protein RNase H-like domain-containing protein n=1 Tax=Pisum sativum TaxID=3888 RepID=A0A9D4XF54_PEA|nr:hypothetical protein KIW84_044027 [Pisum sativum]